jgi:excisionase family DNA binding protein
MQVLESPIRAVALEPLLTVAQVAEALGVAAKTVYRLVDDGELECVRVRGALRFEPATVRAYVEAHRRAG